MGGSYEKCLLSANQYKLRLKNKITGTNKVEVLEYKKTATNCDRFSSV